MPPRVAVTPHHLITSSPHHPITPSLHHLITSLLLATLLLTACAPRQKVTAAELGLRVEAGEAPAVPEELSMMLAWPTPAPQDAEAVEVGRLLFFDPLLSAGEGVSCASCHHPDLGFADGLTHAIGVTGNPTLRTTPSLWNVGDRALLNWDGRADSIEQQLGEGALFHPDEMGTTEAEMVGRVAGNEEYATRLRALYGEVSLKAIIAALSAFQRTLVSRDAPFDRYAAGDFYAMTGAQRRGLEIFRGPRANCTACHPFPRLMIDERKVVGVRDDLGLDDRGFGALTGNEADIGAFAVPTLRNVALSPPYLHNGVEPDLTGAIAFYMNGGGDNPNVPRANLAPELQAFNLNDRELRDLEAFLMALTDESHLPEIPDALPSGLSPVAHRANPMRERIAAEGPLPPGPPRTHEVAPGESLQLAIDRARPGDTIRVAAGEYREALSIDVSDLTIEAEGATLVGRRFTPVGIHAYAGGLTIRGLTITGFSEATLVAHGPAADTMLDKVTLNGHTVSGTVSDLMEP